MHRVYQNVLPNNIFEHPMKYIYCLVLIIVMDDRMVEAIFGGAVSFIIVSLAAGCFRVVAIIGRCSRLPGGFC